MFKSTLVTSTLLSLLLSTGSFAGQDRASVPDLEPAINGAVSAGGRFPTQAMEDAYLDFIAWTEGHGLRGAAAMRAIEQEIEPAMNGAVASRGVFPSQAMEDQYRAYLDWTRANGLGELYAFGPVEG